MVAFNDPNKPIYASGTAPVKKPLPAGPYTNPQGYSTTDLNSGAADTRQYGNFNSGEQLLSQAPSHGQGKDFTILRGEQALQTLGSGVTGGEGDVDVRSALRNQLMSQLGGMENQSAGNRAALNSDIDRGLNNSLATARRQFAGTGQANSLQGGRALGDIVGQSQQARAKGLLDLQNQDTGRLAQLAGTQGAITTQMLQERGYTLEQAKALSSLLQGQSQQEQNSILGSATQTGPSDFEKGLGYLIQGGSAAAIGLSDARAKENITPAGENIEKFLDSVTPYTYDYKDQVMGAGRQTSVMAQDLEKTEAGRALIIETPLGKMVDYGKAFGLMLAANVHLHKEIQKLKEKLNG